MPRKNTFAIKAEELTDQGYVNSGDSIPIELRTNILSPDLTLLPDFLPINTFGDSNNVFSTVRLSTTTEPASKFCPETNSLLPLTDRPVILGIRKPLSYRAITKSVPRSTKVDPTAMMPPSACGAIAVTHPLARRGADSFLLMWTESVVIDAAC